MNYKFRPLRADEIELRVQNVVYSETRKGFSLLLYKDARCDMNILDETVGPMNWQRTHTRENANCAISIWDDDKRQWISKEDTGTESNTEKEKGIASDSFKRAGVNWGIGRELYTAPFIWINGDSIEWKENKNTHKYEPKATFSVSDIGYDDNRRINRLAISVNGNVAWTMGKPAKKEPEQKPEPAPARVICPNCGRTILREKIKGRLYEPETILERCGGVCLTCYKERKNESTDK